MAQTDSINLPPSLAARYSSMIRRNPIGPGDSVIASLQPGARKPSAEPRLSEYSRMATKAAGWLAERWYPGVQRLERSALFARLRADLAAQQFDPDYWLTVTPTDNQTWYAEPTILPFDGVLDPHYFDPSNRPTQSAWNNPSAQYPTPPFPTSAPQPSPGMHGLTVAGYFQDAWLANQVFTFPVPVTISAVAPRPALLLLELAIRATASKAGNRAWFTVQHRVEWHVAAQNPGLTRMLTWYEHAHFFTGALPPANPQGWAHDVTYTALRDTITPLHGSAAQPWDTCTVTVGVPPTQGRYYSNSTFVNVAFDCVPRLLLPRRPED